MPSGLGSQERQGERGNLYRAVVLEAMVGDTAGSRIERQSHKRQSRESHKPNSMKTSVWLCLEGVDCVLVCLYKLEEGEVKREGFQKQNGTSAAHNLISEFNL